MEFNNKVVLITGAANGIGKETAKRFALENAKIVISDINEKKANETLKEIKGFGVDAIVVIANVLVEEEVKKMIEETVHYYGTIDILVNNAGFSKDSLLKNMTVDDWDTVINTNLKGCFLCIKYTAPIMIEQNGGKIINVSSRSYLGNRGQANYSSAKAGIIGLTRAIAEELGKYTINVNAVAPGLTETERLKLHPRYEMIKEKTIKETPLRRICYPEDVANVIMFLASEKASYITGELLHVTGGRNN